MTVFFRGSRPNSTKPGRNARVWPEWLSVTSSCSGSRRPTPARTTGARTRLRAGLVRLGLAGRQLTPREWTLLKGRDQVVNLTLVGSYGAQVAFLAELEEGEALAKVEQATLVSTGGGDLLRGDYIVHVFSQAGQQTAPEVVKAGVRFSRPSGGGPLQPLAASLVTSPGSDSSPASGPDREPRPRPAARRRKVVRRYLPPPSG